MTHAHYNYTYQSRINTIVIMDNNLYSMTYTKIYTLYIHTHIYYTYINTHIQRLTITRKYIFDIYINYYTCRFTYSSSNVNSGTSILI